MTAACSSAVIALLLWLRILGMLVWRGWATRAIQDQRPSCEAGEDNGQRNSRSREEWRAILRSWFALAVCFGSDRTPCSEILGRTFPASSEFHVLPFHS